MSALPDLTRFVAPEVVTGRGVRRLAGRSAANLGARRAPLEEVLRNIRAASLEPALRDGRFEPIPS